MSNLAQTSDALQAVLIAAAEKHARSSGFLQRHSKLTAAQFVQALVLGWMGNRQASASQLAQTAAIGGLSITPQGLNERLAAPGLALLRSVFAAALQQRCCGTATSLALLERFTSIEVFDATTISLPRALWQEYPGCGDRQGASAALKVHVRFDLCSGRLDAQITAARQADLRTALLEQPLRSGALVLWDLGYFALDRFARLSEQGVYWLSRLKGGTQLFSEQGAAIDLLGLLKNVEHLEMAVLIGQQRLAARLLVERVSQRQAEKRRRQLRRNARRHGSTPSAAALALCAYTIVVTNVPEAMLTLSEAMALLRARWQVEILFKLWKSQGQIDEWCSRRPVAILCEFYAKLLGVLLQHWLMLAGAWRYADRSILKAATIIAQTALLLAQAIADRRQLTGVLELLIRLQSTGCRLQRRRKHPSTFQRLDAFSPALP